MVISLGVHLTCSTASGMSHSWSPHAPQNTFSLDAFLDLLAALQVPGLETTEGPRFRPLSSHLRMLSGQIQTPVA